MFPVFEKVNFFVIMGKIVSEISTSKILTWVNGITTIGTPSGIQFQVKIIRIRRKQRSSNWGRLLLGVRCSDLVTQEWREATGTKQVLTCLRGQGNQFHFLYFWVKIAVYLKQAICFSLGYPCCHSDSKLQRLPLMTIVGNMNTSPNDLCYDSKCLLEQIHHWS